MFVFKRTWETSENATRYRQSREGAEFRYQCTELYERRRSRTMFGEGDLARRRTGEIAESRQANSTTGPSRERFFRSRAWQCPRRESSLDPVSRQRVATLAFGQVCLMAPRASSPSRLSRGFESIPTAYSPYPIHIPTGSGVGMSVDEHRSPGRSQDLRRDATEHQASYGPESPAAHGY
jgi:hypothetical protein